MNTTSSPKSLSLPNLSLLRDLLDALASLHDLSDPFASISQLQSALAILAQLATTLGLDANWLAWLQSLQNDSQLLSVVLAIGQYLESFVEPNTPPAPATIHRRPTPTTTTASTIDWNTWLSLLGEIAQLLERLWPAQ